MERNPGMNMPRRKLEKVFGNRPPRRNGLVLEIHNTVPSKGEGDYNVSFTEMDVGKDGNVFALADRTGSLYAVDFLNNRSWRASKVGSCTALCFHLTRKDIVLVGQNDGHIVFVDIELGKIIQDVDAHDSPVQHLCFGMSGSSFISSTEFNAIVWDAVTNTKKHFLVLRANVMLNQIFFIPTQDNIVSCFQEDCIVVWNSSTMRPVKRLGVPLGRRFSYTSLTCSLNGRMMVTGGSSPFVHVYSLETFAFQKSVRLHGVTGVKQLCFVPTLINGSEKQEVLIVLAADGQVYVVDSPVRKVIGIVNDQNIVRVKSSPASKYIACLRNDGCIRVYQISQLVRYIEQLEVGQQPTVRTVRKSGKRMTSHAPIATKGRYPMLASVYPEKRKRDPELLQKLNPRRLQTILRQYMEFPENHRSFIWRFFLKTPGNTEMYAALVNREVHPSYRNLEATHPVDNQKLARGLQRLCSCLAYWSPLFGELSYLPSFVFPFLKEFHKTPVACFEVAATVLINWCQNWFQYFPFPPIGVLSVVENLLGRYDSALLKHFTRHQITGHLYAWSLLQVAFTEVFTRSEWLQFWDHVLFNPPAFFLVAVVAYNVYFRAVLMKCTSVADFKFFFHNQNPIIMKRFIEKIYELHESTETDFYPKGFFKNMQHLTVGEYPVFHEFPTYIVNFQAKERDRIRNEERELTKEQETLIALQKQQDEWRKGDVYTQLEEEHLQLAAKESSLSLQQEELRLQQQRNKVYRLRCELETTKINLLNGVRSRMFGKLEKEENQEEDDAFRNSYIREFYKQQLYKKNLSHFTTGLQDLELPMKQQDENQKEQCRASADDCKEESSEVQIPEGHLAPDSFAQWVSTGLSGFADRQTTGSSRYMETREGPSGDSMKRSMQELKGYSNKLYEEERSCVNAAMRIREKILAQNRSKLVMQKSAEDL